MPALVPTQITGTITWLGRVEGGASIRSGAVETLTLDWAGPVGDKHAGLTRPACVRVRAQHKKGTEIANVRQLSVLCAEEIAAIAAACGLDTLDPALLGATVVISGLPDFSHLPPSARLQTDDGATLVVDMQNHPCHLPAREIEARHPGNGKAFKTAAAGRRGVTAWVERPGTLRLGAAVSLHVPGQRAWAGAG